MSSHRLYHNRDAPLNNFQTGQRRQQESSEDDNHSQQHLNQDGSQRGSQGIRSRGQSHSRQADFGASSARSEMQDQDQDEVQQDQIVHDQDEEAKKEAYGNQQYYEQGYEEEEALFQNQRDELIEEGEEEPLDDQDHQINVSEDQDSLVAADARRSRSRISSRRSSQVRSQRSSRSARSRNSQMQSVRSRQSRSRVIASPSPQKMQRSNFASQEEEDSKDYHTPPEELSEQKQSNDQEFVQPEDLQHVFHEQQQSNAPNGFDQDPDSNFQIIDSQEVQEAQQQPYPQTQEEQKHTPVKSTSKKQPSQSFQDSAKSQSLKKPTSKKSSVRKSSVKKDAGASTDKKPRRSTKKDSATSQKTKAKRGPKPKRQLTAIEENDENSENQPINAFGLDDGEDAVEEQANHKEDRFQDQQMNEEDASEAHQEDGLMSQGYLEQDNQQYLHMDLYNTSQPRVPEHHGELQSVEDANEALDLQQDYQLQPEYEQNIEDQSKQQEWRQQQELQLGQRSDHNSRQAWQQEPEDQVGDESGIEEEQEEVAVEQDKSDSQSQDQDQQLQDEEMQSEQDQEQQEEQPAPRRGFNVFLDKTHSVSSFKSDHQSAQESVEVVYDKIEDSEEPVSKSEISNMEDNDQFVQAKIIASQQSNIEESKIYDASLDEVQFKASGKKQTPIQTQQSVERPVSVAKSSRRIERPASVSKFVQKIERPTSISKSVQKIERPISVTKSERRSVGKSTTKKTEAPVQTPAKTPTKPQKQRNSAAGLKSVSPTPQVVKVIQDKVKENPSPHKSAAKIDRIRSNRKSVLKEEVPDVIMQENEPRGRSERRTSTKKTTAPTLVKQIPIVASPSKISKIVQAVVQAVVLPTNDEFSSKPVSVKKAKSPEKTVSIMKMVESRKPLSVVKKIDEPRQTRSGSKPAPKTPEKRAISPKQKRSTTTKEKRSNSTKRVTTPKKKTRQVTPIKQQREITPVKSLSKVQSSPKKQIQKQNRSQIKSPSKEAKPATKNQSPVKTKLPKRSISDKRSQEVQRAVTSSPARIYANEIAKKTQVAKVEQKSPSKTDLKSQADKTLTKVSQAKSAPKSLPTKITPRSASGHTQPAIKEHKPSKQQYVSQKVDKKIAEQRSARLLRSKPAKKSLTKIKQEKISNEKTPNQMAKKVTSPNKVGKLPQSKPIKKPSKPAKGLKLKAKKAKIVLTTKKSTFVIKATAAKKPAAAENTKKLARPASARLSKFDKPNRASTPKDKQVQAKLAAPSVAAFLSKPQQKSKDNDKSAPKVVHKNPTKTEVKKRNEKASRKAQELIAKVAKRFEGAKAAANVEPKALADKASPRVKIFTKVAADGNPGKVQIQVAEKSVSPKKESQPKSQPETKKVPEVKIVKQQAIKPQKTVPVASRKESRSASKPKEVNTMATAKISSPVKNLAQSQTNTKAEQKQSNKVSGKQKTKAKKFVAQPVQKPKAGTRAAKSGVKVGTKRQGGKTAIAKAASKHGGIVTKRLRKH